MHGHWRRKGTGHAKQQTGQKRMWDVLRPEGSPVSKEKGGGCMKYGCGAHQALQTSVSPWLSETFGTAEASPSKPHSFLLLPRPTF